MPGDRTERDAPRRSSRRRVLHHVSRNPAPLPPRRRRRRHYHVSRSFFAAAGATPPWTLRAGRRRTFFTRDRNKETRANGAVRLGYFTGTSGCTRLRALGAETIADVIRNILHGQQYGFTLRRGSECFSRPTPPLSLFTSPPVKV